MKTKLLAGWLIFIVLAMTASAQVVKCDICGKVITGEFHYMVDEVTGLTNRVCDDCFKLDKCAICGLPVATGGTRLSDGRVLCARDAATAVINDDEAKNISLSTRDDLDRFFSRFMTFPSDDVEISIVDKYHLENVLPAVGSLQTCVTIFGVTASHPLGTGKYLHTIDLLSAMGRTHLMAVTAHEFTHAWMAENVRTSRGTALDRDTIEGFCELVAYKYMASLDQTGEMAFIRRNTYTKGKIDVLIAAEGEYGFEAVVDWIKSGEDSKLDMANLDRVRAVNDATYTPLPSPAVLWTAIPKTVPTPEPDQLELKAISGTPDHRFALINGTPFETLERERVRMGNTNVWVRCLQINAKSVLIQVDGSAKTQELQMHGGN